MAARKMKVSALAVILSLTFGVWCTGFAASDEPTVALERSDLQPDCAGTRLVLEKFHCGQPDFECSFGLAPRSLFSNTLTSSRTDGFAKGGQFWVTAGFPLRAPEEAFFQKEELVLTPQVISARKVPIHLINSVLTI
jgi:hypothetical protein